MTIPVSISHAYWIGDDYLGAIQIISFPDISRHFLCYRCGVFYGKRVVIDADHIKQHWGVWSALCSDCGLKIEWLPHNTHCIPGGIPFFDLKRSEYPEPVLKHQLNKELEFFYARQVPTEVASCEDAL